LKAKHQKHRRAAKEKEKLKENFMRNRKKTVNQPKKDL
jgi:hypothetical protein